MQVRRATHEDAAAIHQLMLASFGSFRPQYTEGCFDATVLDPERIQARMRDGPVWVAIDDDQMIGTVSALVDDRGLYVRGMAVHPEARRGGIGRRLLEACEEFAIAESSSCMWLSTTPFLTASQALYRAFGFVAADGPADLHGTPLVSFAKRLP